MIPYYIFKDINEKIYCSCKLPKNEVIFPYLHRPTTSVTKSWITQLISTFASQMINLPLNQMI